MRLCGASMVKSGDSEYEDVRAGRWTVRVRLLAELARRPVDGEYVAPEVATEFTRSSGGPRQTFDALSSTQPPGSRCGSTSTTPCP